MRLPLLSPKFLVGTVGSDLLIKSDEVRLLLGFCACIPLFFCSQLRFFKSTSYRSSVFGSAAFYLVMMLPSAAKYIPFIVIFTIVLHIFGQKKLYNENCALPVTFAFSVHVFIYLFFLTNTGLCFCCKVFLLLVSQG